MTSCSIAALIGYILGTAALVGGALYAGLQGIIGWLVAVGLAVAAQGMLFLISGVITSCQSAGGMGTGTGSSGCSATNMNNTITALRVVLGIAITGYGTAALIFWNIFNGGPAAAAVASTSANVACGVALALLVSFLAFAIAYGQCFSSMMGTGTGAAGAGAAPTAAAKATKSTTSTVGALEVLNEVPIGQWDLGLLIKLHRRLLPKHPYRGQLRNQPGVVRLNGRVLRELPPPSKSVRMANAALARLNTALQHTRETDWPSIAADTILSLAEAHPFKDGNGRVSRAVATWVLIRGGRELRLHPDAYCWQNAASYYAALTEAMNAGNKARNELWDRFFTGMVETCFKPVADVS